MDQKIDKFFSSKLCHRVLIAILAIIVGFLYITPQLVIRAKLLAIDRPYVLIQTTHHSDEANVYVPRAREVYDGHWPAMDFYFDSNLPSVFPVLPSLLTGGFIYLSGGNTDIAYLSATFVFSAMIFLLFYILGQVVVKNKWWSILIGLVGVLTPVALHLPRAFMSTTLFGDIVLKNFFPLVRTNLDRLFFGRIDDPLITYIFYLPAVISLIWFWRKPNWLRAGLAGLLAGLLFHVYFHYAFYWALVLILLFFYTLVFKRREIRLLKYLTALLFTAAVVASPYILEYLMFRVLPWSQDYVFRIGTEVGRGFRLASVRFDYLAYVLFSAAIYILLWRAKNDPDRKNQAVLFWIFLLAIFIAWNIQLVTGFMPHPSHWRKAISPVLFVVAISLIAEIISRFKGIKHFLSLGMIVIILASAMLLSKKIVNVYKFYQMPATAVAEYSFNPSLADSWNWINWSIADEPKIVSNSFLTSVYLSTYTSARPYLAIGGNTPVSNEKLEHNYLTANKIFGISEDMLRRRLIPPSDQNLSVNLLDDPFYLYSSYWREKSFDYAFTSSDKSIPMEKVDELLNRYRALQTGRSGMAADYLYYGPWEKEFSDKIPSWLQESLIYMNPEVKIYRLKKDIL